MENEREELKTICRSMITASYANNLDDEVFDKYIDEIVGYRRVPELKVLTDEEINRELGYAKLAELEHVSLSMSRVKQLLQTQLDSSKQQIEDENK